jgi:hypothetical protein
MCVYLTEVNFFLKQIMRESSLAVLQRILIQ